MTPPAASRPALLPRLLVALAAAVIGFAGALAITGPPGPGLDDDAKDYLGAAESFARGEGLRVPTAWWQTPRPSEALGHFPPGLPVLLALPVRLGVRPISAARAEQAVAAGVTAGGVALLAGAVSPAAGAAAAFLLLITPDLALDHGRVLSEPLFLALLAATLLLVVRRPDRPALAGIAGMLLCMVRYAGAGVVGAVGIIELLRGGSVRERLRRAALATVPALVALAAWSLSVSRHKAHVRDIEWHGTLLPALAVGARTLRDWMAPGLADAAPAAAAILAGLGFAGFALLARAAWRAAGEGGERRLLQASAVVAATYVAFLCASRLLADPWIPFDERLLAPLFVLAPPVAALGLVRGWPAWRAGARAAAAILVLAWTAGSVRLTYLTAVDFRTDGWGYSAPDFLAGGTVEWLRTPAAQGALFSNNPAAIWFVTGRSAWFVPAASEPDSALRSFADTLRARRGLVVAFTDGDETMVDPKRLAARLGLVPVATFDDGTVWKPAPVTPASPLAAPRRAP